MKVAASSQFFKMSYYYTGERILKITYCVCSSAPSKYNRLHFMRLCNFQIMFITNKFSPLKIYNPLGFNKTSELLRRVTQNFTRK
jgi:hypothetical protein